MAAKSERAINECAAALGPEKVNDFLEQHRLMRLTFPSNFCIHCFVIIVRLIS